MVILPRPFSEMDMPPPPLWHEPVVLEPSSEAWVLPPVYMKFTSNVYAPLLNATPALIDK